MNDNKILSGTIWKAILGFFFPIMIGTFFQQLYNTVDAAIVGQFAGKEALSSVGGSSAIIINLMVGFFTGLSAGCTVLISQFYGAKNKESLDTALHTSYAFAIIGGLIIGTIGFLAVPWAIDVTNTPQELKASSILYLRVYCVGLVFVFIYNMGAAILRALGDSRRPLIFLIICTVVNIVLDLIFVVAFNLGVLGVAIATLISQAISAILVTDCIMKRTEGIELIIKKIRINGRMLGKMLKIGLPSGIQSSTYAISNMFIQSAINLFGVDTVAGWTAEGKVDVIFWMINGSFGIAAATFVGQNYGAKNIERVRKGTRTCLLMSLSTALVLSVILFFFGKYALWIFTKETAVVEIATHMIQLIVPGYAIFVFIEILSASLRAQGDTIIPTIINLATIVGFRIAWIAAWGHSGNLDMVIYCYPISWAICAIAIVGYYLGRRKKTRL